MSQAVHPNGVQTGVIENHLTNGSGSRIPFKDHFYIASQLFKHLFPPHATCPSQAPPAHERTRNYRYEWRHVPCGCASRPWPGNCQDLAFSRPCKIKALKKPHECAAVKRSLAEDIFNLFFVIFNVFFAGHFPDVFAIVKEKNLRNAF